MWKSNWAQQIDMSGKTDKRLVQVNIQIKDQTNSSKAATSTIKELVKISCTKYTNNIIMMFCTTTGVRATQIK